MDVGCALAAQLLAREQTWRDEYATYIGVNNDLARFHTLSHAADDTEVIPPFRSKP